MTHRSILTALFGLSLVGLLGANTMTQEMDPLGDWAVSYSLDDTSCDSLTLDEVSGAHWTIYAGEGDDLSIIEVGDSADVRTIRAVSMGSILPTGQSWNIEREWLMPLSGGDITTGRINLLHGELVGEFFIQPQWLIFDDEDASIRRAPCSRRYTLRGRRL